MEMGNKGGEMDSKDMESYEMESNDMKGNEMESKDMTGYKLASEVNKVLKMESLAEIKPQMVYNYINNNLIPSYTSKTGQTLVKYEDGMKWIDKYVNNKKTRQNS